MPCQLIHMATHAMPADTYGYTCHASWYIWLHMPCQLIHSYTCHASWHTATHAMPADTRAYSYTCHASRYIATPACHAGWLCRVPLSRFCLANIILNNAKPEKFPELTTLWSLYLNLWCEVNAILVPFGVSCISLRTTSLTFHWNSNYSIDLFDLRPSPGPLLTEGRALPRAASMATEPSAHQLQSLQ